jgi:hypothetical protein
MSVLCRRINAERRRGNVASVHKLYRDLIDNCKTGGQGPILRNFISAESFQKIFYPSILDIFSSKNS